MYLYICVAPSLPWHRPIFGLASPEPGYGYGSPRHSHPDRETGLSGYRPLGKPRGC